MDDLVALRRLGDFRVSPDGGRIVYALSTLDLAANRRRVDLWLANADGSGARQLTHTPESEASPRWAPDGKAIYFLSSRSGSSQVWRMPADGGEAEPVTTLPLDVGASALSPRATHVVVALEIFPDYPTLACTTERLDANSKRKASGRVFDRH